MYRIAVYGKGGIGKSTISANLSYILSNLGNTVLHVGCDPKHDSTRLLTNGECIVPFCSDMTANPVHACDDGLWCSECGGAEPGKGCAGKGVELLLSKLEDIQTDFRIYDVLGDVVCGGFSVPARSSNTDGVIIVTSGEFMSIYAANNILRGLKTINPHNSIIGIVLNRRGNENEDVPVRIFAESVGLPILCDIPRSSKFKEAESNKKTISAQFPDCDETRCLKRLAEFISSDPTRYDSKPLSEQAMMDIAAGRRPSSKGETTNVKTCSFDSIDPERNLTYVGNYVLPACTSHGATDGAMRITDAAVILHGPRNCAYLMEYAFRRRVLLSSSERSNLFPDPGIYSTNLDSAESFKDTGDNIKNAALRAKSDGYRHAFLIPTCSSEIIGTDLKVIASRVSESTGMDIIPVNPDTTFLGSKFGGTYGLFDALISRMEHKDVVKGTVNLIARWFYASGKVENAEGIETILRLMGLRTNVRLLDFCTLDAVNEFCSAELDIQLGNSSINRNICKRISEVTGRRVALQLEVPIGLSECLEWVERISEYQPELVTRRVEAEATLRKMFEDGVEKIRHRVRGRRAIVYCLMVRDLGWQIETLKAIGIDIEAIMFSDSNVIDHNIRIQDYGDIPVIKGMKLCDLRKMIKERNIDIILTNDVERVSRLGVAWAPLMSRRYGLEGSIEWAGIVADSINVPNGRWEVRL